MQTTIEFLDALKSLNNQCSDYRVAKILNVNTAAVSNWRHGKSFFDDSVCERVAEALGLPPEYVMACIHAERAKTDSQKAAWSRLAATFQYAAASFVAVVGGLSLAARFLPF